MVRKEERARGRMKERRNGRKGEKVKRMLSLPHLPFDFDLLFLSSFHIFCYHYRLKGMRL
jgi:hypothetical protein